MAAPSHDTAALSQISLEADEKICAELREIVGLLNGQPSQQRSNGAHLMRLINLAQTCRASLFFSVSDFLGGNALHAAAYHLQPEYCGLLLARGADPDARNDSGETAVHFLVKHEYIRHPGKVGDVSAREGRVLDVLVKWGINLDAPNDEGNTALLMACTYGKTGLVRALFEAPGERAGWERSGEIEVNARKSVLVEAMVCGNIDIVRLLCWIHKPRVLVELESEDDEYESLEDMARSCAEYEIADIFEGVEFVRELTFDFKNYEA